MAYTLRSGKPGEADYTPYGEARRFFLSHAQEAIIAGPRDTGKTIAALNKIHVLACKYPESSLVICRKQLVDVYPTVLQTWEKKVVAQEIAAGVIVPFGGKRPEWYDYQNGSRVWVAGLDKPGKALSGERDLIYVNQAEEATLDDWEPLISTTTGRAGNIPYPQTIGDCNPAAPSHWIRQRMKAGLLELFNSTHRDNPDLYDQRTGEITEAGKARIGVLDRLTGARKKRYRYGLWAAPEGSIYGDVFDGLREDGEYGRHMVPAFDIPRHWPRVVGIDPAGARRCALWLAYEQEHNRLHVYRELLVSYGVTVAKFCDDIKAAGQGEPVFAWIVGAKAERDWRVEFTAQGIPAQEPPVADVWVGIDRVYNLLDEFALVIHDTCKNLLSEIEEYHRKQSKRTGEFEDVIENKGKYHGMDALRMAVVWLTHSDATQERVVYNPIRIGNY